MDDFTIKPFTWYCGCGFKPKKFANGIASNGYLTARFHCPKCKMIRIARFSFEEIKKYLPAPPAPKILLPAATWTVEDQKYLSKLKICLQEH